MLICERHCITCASYNISLRNNNLKMHDRNQSLKDYIYQGLLHSVYSVLYLAFKYAVLLSHCRIITLSHLHFISYITFIKNYIKNYIRIQIFSLMIILSNLNNINSRKSPFTRHRSFIGSYIMANMFYTYMFTQYCCCYPT